MTNMKCLRYYPSGVLELFETEEEPTDINTIKVPDEFEFVNGVSYMIQNGELVLFSMENKNLENNVNTIQEIRNALNSI